MWKYTKEQWKEITRQHFESRISQTELAKKFKVSRQTIIRQCHKIGISPLIKYYKEDQLDSKLIIKLYVEDKLPAAEIARRLHVTNRPIFFRLRLAGIKIRKEDYKKKRDNFAITIPQYNLRLDIWRGKVIERDELKCKMCQSIERLEAHHIIPVRSIIDKNLLFDIKNGITLCRHCHRTINRKEAVYIDTFKKLIGEVQ